MSFKSIMTTTAIATSAMIASVAAPSAASADVLYDNGPVNGTLIAYTLHDFGSGYNFTVANSFSLSQDSTVTGVTFGAWAFPGEVPTSIDFTIESSLDLTAPGTTVAVTPTYLFTNDYGYDIYDLAFSTGDLSLAAGDYYLLLQNSVDDFGYFYYWDANGGPSTAYQNITGQLPLSESFQIIGTAATSPGGVPEPATWAMMLSGFGLVGAGLRRRSSRLVQAV